MDCSECNQDIRENLLLKWNYQDLLKDIGKNLTLMSYDFDSDTTQSVNDTNDTTTQSVPEPNCEGSLFSKFGPVVWGKLRLDLSAVFSYG